MAAQNYITWATAMNKKQSKPYKGLIDRNLTDEEVKQLDHNLIRFVELLIKLDKQQKQAKDNN